MQIVSSQTNIVEKILRDKNGKLVRARFAVYEIAGRVKARLLDFTYIETLKGVVLKLSGSIKNRLSTFVKILKIAFNPPVLKPETIYYSGSKPRAPTFI